MNKITNQFQLLLISAMVFSTVSIAAQTPDTLRNKYGLWVISNTTVLQQTCMDKPGKIMINLGQTIPQLVFDLRYATTNNFMQQRLYPHIKSTWMRKKAADSLAGIQKELAQQGLGLKIFDAYRPYSVTEKLWEPVRDDRYAADPKKGSGHNRGIAVDLTLVDLQTGKELDMGTGFDNFSDSAHHAFTGLPAKTLQNRSFLKAIMEKHGFKALDTEWWHYSLPDASSYELLDIGFAELKKYSRKMH